MTLQLRLPFFIYGFSQLSTRSVRNRKPPAMGVRVKKYIQEQEAHDIMMDKLSVKEYEDPFKG